ncbi:hypothetical protein C0995_014763 [Termitomyces sp. Mi166|nr:hypothetical protein C0995_014763 [Termitomyces sp. Mi166\
MRVEERRKQFMASGSKTAWGDRPSSSHAGPRENSNTLCNCSAESTAARPIGPLNHVVNARLPFDTHRRLSTRRWTLGELLKQGKRFSPVTRVPLKSAKKAVINFEESGIPRIISGLHQDPSWPKDCFQPDWLEKYGPKGTSVQFNSTFQPNLFNGFLEISVRNVHNSTDKTMPLDEFIEGSRRIAPIFPSSKEENGSSFWFMTDGRDATKASQFFDELKHKMGHEDHVLTVQQLSKAPFVIYVAEQKLGDLVLVPPRSCHQVVNFGGLTIKTSWSRMTLKGLEAAYYHELPMYRRVCYPEKYRVKLLIYITLLKRREALASLTRNYEKSQGVLVLHIEDKKLVTSTETLLKLFGSVLLEESPPRNLHLHCLQSATLPPNSSNSSNAPSAVIARLTCDFCGADIFQSFFECLKCVPSRKGPDSSTVKHGDGLVICPGCYIEGRSCNCGDMDPIQCRPFQELVSAHNQVVELLSKFKSNPMPKYEDTNPNLAMRTFRAAYLLQDMRKKSEGKERTCSACVGGSGHAISSWVLDCKKCHRGRCFTHILASQKLHAADAILIHFSNTSHEVHHRSHGSLQKYKEGRDHLVQTQRIGYKPDPSQQRVYLAEQYRTCRPVNYAYVRAGWYDVHVEVTPVNIETEKNCMDVSQDPPAGNPSPSRSLSSLAVLEDSPLSLPLDISDSAVQTTSGAVTSVLKRKRQVMDFVAVPDPPYKIRMLRRPAPESDFSDSREMVSTAQSVNRGLSPFSSNALEVPGQQAQDHDTMQVESPGSSSSLAITRRNRLQSSASGSMAPLTNPKNFTLPAPKRTAKHIAKEGDISALLILPRSRSMSSASTKSSQSQQRSQVLEVPAREDPEPHETVTDVGTAGCREPSRNRENVRKRVMDEVSSRQPQSTTSGVVGLAEAFNTAAINNHSALDVVDGDRLLAMSSNNGTLFEEAAEATTSISADKTPLANTSPSASSQVAFDMIREPDQDVMQIDSPRSPPAGRRDRVPLRSPSSASPTPSPPEINPRHSTSINAEKHGTSSAQHGSKKCHPRPTSSTPTMSLSTPSTSTRSLLAKQVQTRLGERNSTRDGPFLIPITPNQSSKPAKATERRQTLVFESDTRPRQLPLSGPISNERVIPEASSSNRQPTPGVAGLTGVSSSIATRSNSVHNASDIQPVTANINTTPSDNSIVPDVAPSAPIDKSSLESTVQELHRAIDESQHISSRVVDAIVTVADAMNKLTNQHPQGLSAFSPTWPQGNYPSMFDTKIRGPQFITVTVLTRLRITTMDRVRDLAIPTVIEVINLIEKTLNDGTTELIHSPDFDTILLRPKTDPRVRYGLAMRAIEHIRSIRGMLPPIAELTTAREWTCMEAIVSLSLLIRRNQLG